MFQTVDGGATWTRIDLTLPDMPVHSVVVHPTRASTLYIGTDLGVFVTTDGGGTWMRENTGFANGDRYDGFHPNASGEAKIASRWLEALAAPLP